MNNEKRFARDKIAADVRDVLQKNNYLVGPGATRGRYTGAGGSRPGAERLSAIRFSLIISPQSALGGWIP